MLEEYIWSLDLAFLFSRRERVLHFKVFHYYLLCIASGLPSHAKSLGIREIVWKFFPRQEPLFSWEAGGQRRLVIDSETQR